MSKKTYHLISFSIFFGLYLCALVAVDRLGYIPERFVIDQSSLLPKNYVSGVISWSPGMARVSSSGIYVVDGNNVRHRLDCLTLDWVAFPDAVPCTKNAFADINGKLARVWYLKSKQKLIWGEGEVRLVVQIKIDNGPFYSFDAFKKAAISAQKINNLKWVLFCIFINGVLISSVWFFVVRRINLKYIKGFCDDK